MSATDPKYLSKDKYSLLMTKLKEFQKESGVVIFDFLIRFPYYGGPGLPVNITMKVEMRD